MIDIDKKYMYRNGEIARILCVDRPFGDNLPVLSMRPNGAIVQSQIDGKSQCWQGEFDLIEVWQPTEGEICYVWNEGASLPNIRKYIRTSLDGIFLCISRNGLKIHDRNGYKYCAPFNGKLPGAFE